MKVSYDPVADAIYIFFSESRKSTKTKEVSSDINVDYDGDDLIGIEILNASKKLPKNEAEQVTFTLPTYKGRVITAAR